MNINYSDLFSDENKNNYTIEDNFQIKNEICFNETKLLGKKFNRENNDIEQINKSIKNKNIEKNKKNNKNRMNEHMNDNEKKGEINNKFKIKKPNETNDLYFKNNIVNIDTESKFDFNNIKKSKYQDILGNKKSILKIQEYVFDSNLLNSKINYKVVTQIKTINFKTDNSVFQKGKLIKEENENNLIIAQKLIDNGSMPSIGFWNQRYYYFRKFEKGILLDFESNKCYLFFIKKKIHLFYKKKNSKNI